MKMAEGDSLIFFVLILVVDITFVHDERNLILQAVDLLLSFLAFIVLSTKCGKLLLELMQIISRVGTVVVAPYIINH
ncbi:hypothetical protein D3C76_1271220 [compost metagenome]